MARAITDGSQRVYAAPIDLETGLPTAWMEIGGVVGGVEWADEPGQFDSWDPIDVSRAIQGASVSMQVTLNPAAVWMLRALVEMHLKVVRRRSRMRSEYHRRQKRRGRR